MGDVWPDGGGGQGLPHNPTLFQNDGRELEMSMQSKKFK